MMVNVGVALKLIIQHEIRLNELVISSRKAYNAYHAAAESNVRIRDAPEAIRLVFKELVGFGSREAMILCRERPCS